MSRGTEEELSCPVCQDIFRDPVVLSCSHSFCNACLKKRWRENEMEECPVCKRRSSRSEPPSNLVLKRLCEGLLLRKNDAPPSLPGGLVCSSHSERLTVFCVDHQQPVCLVCLHSDAHAGHSFRPINEVLKDYREEVWRSLKPLRIKLKLLEDVKENFAQTAEHIKEQAQNTEKQIRDHFEKLRQFLQKEEKLRVEALRDEEEKKFNEMKERVKALSRDIKALSDTIAAMEKDLKAQDQVLLHNYRTSVEATQQRPLLDNPQLIPAALIDVAKHLGNLSYNIWTRMKTMVSYSPVVLDPNTSHPELVLSEDLTTVRHQDQKQELPQNPERFDVCRIVLGSVGFRSGTHTWDVEVGVGTNWFVGVAAESVQKKGKHPSKLWRVGHFEGEYIARSLAEPSTVLTGLNQLRKIRVYLDWDRGQLRFYDLDTDTHIYTFTHTFNERLYPYFNTVNTRPIKIIIHLECSNLILM
uniref:Zinc-binding protein A33-like n=1 Tax=Gouania willdenowi TaxID=441366 RepID=A0A8C5FY65_GOUWI